MRYYPRSGFNQRFPSIPAVAIKIIEIANDPTADMASVCQYISLDPVLAAKLLPTVNSSNMKQIRQDDILSRHCEFALIMPGSTCCFKRLDYATEEWYC